MFDSSAAQFLAVLEALSEPKRRVLQTGLPVLVEVEVRDVYAELFLAGGELLSDLSGGPMICGKFDFVKTVNTVSSQIKLAIEGKDGVSISSVEKLIKLSFTFEEWSLFNCSAGQFIIFLQSQKDTASKKAELDIRLLVAMEPLINLKRNKGLIYSAEGGSSVTNEVRNAGKKIMFHESNMLYGNYSDDIFHLGTMLYSFTCLASEEVHPDKEIAIDVIMFLWQKCKLGIQWIHSSKIEYSKFVQRIKTSKWVHLLWQINEMICTYEMDDLDPVIVAEVTLRLSEILETLGNPSKKFQKSSGIKFDLDNDFTQSPSDTIPIFKKTPQEQLLLAYEILEKAIRKIGMTRTRSTLPNGASVYDHCYTKVIAPEEDKTCGKPLTTNSFIMDLQQEIILTQHRITVVLLDQLKAWDSPLQNLGNPEEAQSTKEPTATSYFTESYILKKINKNRISKAIYLMQKALLLFEKDPCQDSTLLEEALSLIKKTEAEQNALYSYQKDAEDGKIPTGKVPPPPILLARTHCSVTFKPALFICDKKIAWYTILGCRVGTCFGKVRLNNYCLPNCGEPVPANDKTVLEVVGLEPNEKYLFAVAAYGSDGELIGKSVGESTKPILIYTPLSTVTTRLYLTEVAYQVGKHSLTKKAFAPVWDYFVYTPSPANPSIISLTSKLTITPHRLHADILTESSSILLYHFIRCVFITSNINIMDQKLFCDTIRGDEVFTCQQIYRLTECQRMLVAIELSTYLNDLSYSLQAVVQCYGLLAPLIFHNIVLVPVIQILIKCLVVLQEIPIVNFPKKQMGNFESIQHMIACSVYYTTKVLRSWKEFELAVMIINIGKKLLDSSQSFFPNVAKTAMSDDEQEEEMEEGFLFKKMKKTKAQIVMLDKITEQLNLMETQLLRLTKQSPFLELTGAEDPLLLYPVILTWTFRSAMKEVMKFKNRPRFLEFYVQIMTKCINEEKYHFLVEMSYNVQNFLKRRTENWLGLKKAIVVESVDTNDPKKFKAAAMEIHKSTEFQLPRPTNKKKENVGDYLSRHLSLSDSPDVEKYKKTDTTKNPLKVLSNLLGPKAFRHLKRKKWHQICIEELSWRSQMNIYLATSHFNMFKTKLAERKKIKVCNSQIATSFRSLDPDMFTVYNSGTLLEEENVNTENYKAMLEFLLSNKIRKTNFSDIDEFSYTSSKVSEGESSKVQASSDGESSGKDRMANLGILEHFIRTFSYCRRAVVFAHRGGYWTLLQNASRLLWSYALEVQMLLQQANISSKGFPVSKDAILCTFVLPFYLTSEALLDMLVDLQNSKSLKILDDNKDFGTPSAYGSIEDDNGGFNLTFEEPFDDVNLVDLKHISDFIFKTLEILYRVGKWETLAHIALYFNEITHERYTEQVTPMLVYAQRKLLERVKKFSGQDIKIENEIEDKINPRNVIGVMPHPAFRPNEAVGRGGFIDFEQAEVHSEINQANRLISVPLNVKETLRNFRETLGKSKYYNRSLRYSRKLLSLLLVNAQEGSGISNPKIASEKVEFRQGTEEMYLPTPPDLSNEKFAFSAAVENKKLSPSQFQIVIVSYEKTIDILEASNQIDLKIQALHELGNLHVYAENKRAAYKCWSQALDAILKKSDVLHTWKEMANPHQKPTDFIMGSNFVDYSEEFLLKAGVWGCLQGGVIAAKMAQYMLTSNVNERTECCIFSSYFFKALLRTSLIHPRHDHEYAQYEISQLLPGLDLFCDRYRADVTVVLSSLMYISYELHSVQHNLIILPLLALYHYFVTDICQDVCKGIDAKFLKIEVLIDLGFFSEAYAGILNLYPGKISCNSIPTCSKFFGKTKHITQPFKAEKPCMSKENIQALEDLLNQAIPGNVILMCHPAFISKFTLVKMHFLISLAATINCLPENEVKPFFLDFPLLGSTQTLSNKESGKDDIGTIINLTKSKEELTPGKLKGILLMEAEDKLLMLIESAESSICKRIIKFKPVELELMIKVKLQLAAIALQRQRAPFSTSIVFTCLKILQNAKVFQKTKEEMYECPGEMDTLEPLGMSAREHLNIHLWLRCRLALVMASVAHIRGMAVMKENDVTDCRHLINEVLVEARDWNDTEMQAELLVQAVKLDLQERHSATEIIKHLQDIIHLLQGKPFVSPRGSLILVKSLVLMDDLMKIEKTVPLSPENENLHLLKQAHALIIEQVLYLGETIKLPSSDNDYANIMYPLTNVYLPYINLMAKVKMRIAYVLAKQVASSQQRDPSQWASVIHLFEIALYHCRTAAIQEDELEAEILFEKGKSEFQMFIADDTKDITEDIFKAIRISLKNDQNLGLIRKAYLEIALLYLHLRKLKKTTVKSKGYSRYQNLLKETREKSDLYLTLSWIAIRAASQVSEAIRATQKLIGQKKIVTEKIERNVMQSIPEFAVVDLTSTYIDYLMDNNRAVFKPPFSLPKEYVNVLQVSSEDQDHEMTENGESEKSPKLTISWVHLVRYYTHLLRINNMNTLLGSPRPIFLSDQIFHTSIFNRDLILRQKEMHSFLKKFLDVFTPACVESFPKDLLIGVEKQLPRQSIKESQEIAVIIEKMVASKMDLVPSDFSTDFASYTVSKTLCFQWYLPPLEKPPKDPEPMVMLLYAFNIKAARVYDAREFNSSHIYSKSSWLPLNKVKILHEKLSGLRQEAETLLYTHPLSTEESKTVTSSLPVSSDIPENIMLTKEMKASNHLRYHAAVLYHLGSWDGNNK
ncbi:cilia- and flagella-associated protein 54 isoform X3 [Macrotis lagotis]